MLISLVASLDFTPRIIDLFRRMAPAHEIELLCIVILALPQSLIQALVDGDSQNGDENQDSEEHTFWQTIAAIMSFNGSPRENNESTETTDDDGPPPEIQTASSGQIKLSQEMLVEIEILAAAFVQIDIIDASDDDGEELDGEQSV